MSKQDRLGSPDDWKGKAMEIPSVDVLRLDQIVPGVTVRLVLKDGQDFLLRSFEGRIYFYDANGQRTQMVLAVLDDALRVGNYLGYEMDDAGGTVVPIEGGAISMINVTGLVDPKAQRVKDVLNGDTSQTILHGDLQLETTDATMVRLDEIGPGVMVTVKCGGSSFFTFQRQDEGVFVCHPNGDIIDRGLKPTGDFVVGGVLQLVSSSGKLTPLGGKIEAIEVTGLRIPPVDQDLKARQARFAQLAREAVGGAKTINENPGAALDRDEISSLDGLCRVMKGDGLAVLIQRMSNNQNVLERALANEYYELAGGVLPGYHAIRQRFEAARSEKNVTRVRTILQEAVNYYKSAIRHLKARALAKGVDLSPRAVLPEGAVAVETETAEVVRESVGTAIAKFFGRIFRRGR